MTWGLIRFSKSKEDLADVEVPGGKKLPYFVQRLSGRSKKQRAAEDKEAVALAAAALQDTTTDTPPIPEEGGIDEENRSKE